MKNLILLTTLLFISTKAFAIAEVKYKALATDDLFHAVFETSYCEFENCLVEYNPGHAEKISSNTEDLILRNSEASILENLKLRAIKVIETDFIKNPTHYELLDLLQLDFSSADGDIPLTRSEVSTVINLISYKGSFSSIMGVVTEEGISEYLIIYTPESDKVYHLERAQFSKKSL